MFKKAFKQIEMVLAIFALAMIILIFLNPPTDFDGGPMMAYNFLFFFPILLVAGMVALISMVISIKRISNKEGSKKAYPILSIIISTPVLLYFILIAARLFFPKHDPELEAMLADLDKPSEIYNSTIEINLDSGKTIYLVGFNWGKYYQNKRVYISLSPYQEAEFQVTEAFNCQGNKDFELFYKYSSDSLMVFISDKEPMYHYINATRIDEIPVRAIQLDEFKFDSLRNEAESNEINNFEWKKL